METLIESLNRWGNRANDFAWPLLWQSSLLIGALLLLDLLLRRRARAVLRYALWLLVLLKLLLPPSLALPTGLGYWLSTSHPPTSTPPPPRAMTVITVSGTVPVLPASSWVAPTQPKLSRQGELLLVWLAGSAILLGFLVRRSWQAARLIRQADAANEELQSLLDRCRRQLGLRNSIRLRLSTSAFSPAVCGLWRPAVLLPRELAQRLTPDQLRAVLFHELVHLQRHDVWVNCLQALLQVAYWWHPLVWLANARIRRVREEAVDEAVMVALGSQAETYPVTLLEVAKLAFARPLTALGLVGIFESKGALQKRIRRLLDRPVPRSAKLNVAGILAVAACGALLLPMARGNRAGAPTPATPAATLKSPAANVLVECRFLEIDEDVLRSLAAGPPVLVGTNGHQAWVILPAEVPDRLDQLTKLPGVRLISAPRMTLVSGMTGQISDTHGDSLNGRDVNLRSTCEVTALINGTDIDLTLKASINELAEVDGNGSPAVAASASGHVSREVANVRLTVPDGGGVIVQNPSLQATQGGRLVLVVKPAVQPDARGARAGAEGSPPMADATTTETETLLPETKLQKQRVATLVQDGKLLYEMGRFDEAEARLKSATTNDPSNQAAYYYLKLIAEARSYSRTRDRKGMKKDEAAGTEEIRLPPTQPEDLPTPNPKGDAQAQLETRVFKVDPNTFLEGLQAVGAFRLGDSAQGNSRGGGWKGGFPEVTETIIPFLDVTRQRGGWKGGLPEVTETNLTQAVQDAVRAFFLAAGIDLSPPHQLYYNDRRGLLMVRATPQELDIIQKAIEVLNVAPPQLTIEAKFIEAPAEFVKGIAQGTLISSPDATNQMRILSEPQTRALLEGLEKTAGVSILAAPKVTTLSGRQTQIQVVDFRTIVTGIDPQAVVQPGRTARDATNASPFILEQVPLAPTLDLIPSVAEDGYTLELTALANLTEFLGYDKATNTVSVYVNGEKQDVKPPLPRMRTRQANGRAFVYDGQSLLLIGPAAAVTNRFKDKVPAQVAGDSGAAQGAAVTNRFEDKVPVLGDLPLVGRLFRSEGTSRASRQLLILMTPTVIDPAGNSIHTPDNLPFDPNTIPPQSK